MKEVSISARGRRWLSAKVYQLWVSRINCFAVQMPPQLRQRPLTPHLATPCLAKTLEEPTEELTSIHTTNLTLKSSAFVNHIWQNYRSILVLTLIFQAWATVWAPLKLGMSSFTHRIYQLLHENILYRLLPLQYFHQFCIYTKISEWLPTLRFVQLHVWAIQAH